MALADAVQYSSNDTFFSIDGTDVSDVWVGTGTLTPTNSPTDVSSGAGSDHEKWKPGMNSTELAVNLFIPAGSPNQVILLPLIQPGVERTWIYGPLGNGTDMPMLEQKFIVMTAPISTGQKKDTFVQFTLTLKGSDGPITEFWTGQFP